MDDSGKPNDTASTAFDVMVANRANRSPEVRVGGDRAAFVDEIVELASLMRIPVAPVGTGRSLPQTDHLVERGVSTAPGTAFGFQAPHALRLSLATSTDAIRQGVGILTDWYRETSGGARDLAIHAAH